MSKTFLLNQVFLLVHAFDVKSKDLQKTKLDLQNTVTQSDTKELHSDSEILLNSEGLPNSSSPNGVDCSMANAHSDDTEKHDDKITEGSSFIEGKCVGDSEIGSSENVLEEVRAGAHWDIFRHEDIPKLMEYISIHWADFGKADSINDNSVSYFIVSEIYLDTTCFIFISL